MSDEIELKISGVLDDTPNKFVYESSHLRSIFPEEVWIAILDRVKLLFPEELENWSNSSLYFRYLLEDQRVIFLFPKVFKILAPKYEERYSESFHELKKNCYRENPVVDVTNHDSEHEEDDNEDNGSHDGDPPDWDGLVAHALTAVMKCRLVCRSWNKAIQDYYEDPSNPTTGGFHFEMKFDRNQIQMGDDNVNESWDAIDLWKNCRFEGHDHETPRIFVNYFEETHYLKKNPFMGRSLSIQSYLPQGFEDDADIQFYFDRMDDILRNYGEEVWYCKIGLDEDETDPGIYPQLYLRLRGWLSLMPNLKTLRIVQELYPEEEWTCLEPLNECLPMLMREIRENPMPTLEKLEFLSVENVLGPVFNELIRRNGHVTGLEMERGEAHEKIYNYDFDYVLSSMPNLKRLGIHSFTEEELGKLEKKMGEGLRLETFQLMDEKGAPFHWGRLLGLVKGSSKTLTDLVLELPFVGNKEGEDLLELTGSQDKMGYVEKLERLVLFVGRPLFLDWLLPVKDTLKELELVVPPYLRRVKGYDKVVGEQEIEFHGFEEKMEQSNIWKAFGNLKSVKIGKGYLSECEEWKEFTRP